MDTTTLEAQITTLEATIVTDQTTLASDQSQLTILQNELAQATGINWLESLTPDQVATVNSVLSADGSQISVSLPPVTEPS